MQYFQSSVHACWSASLFAILVGCGESTPPPSEGAAGPLSQALASWESGDKDAAAKLLVAVDWSAADLGSGEPGLSVSEQEFASLSSTEKNEVQADAVRIAAPLRDLGRHTVSLGTAAVSSGDDQMAQSYFQAAMNLGKALSDENRLLAIQGVGKAIVAMADEQIAAP